ncbi:hypothetical protein [Prosthecobacter sp.]|uniref:hypothetical protein n=1 Tax=Prosthecobacter sp. TaxID=1965333 RepID=UPI0037849F9D
MEELHAKYEGKTVQIVGGGTLTVTGKDVWLEYTTRGDVGVLVANSIKLTPEQLKSLAPHKDTTIADFFLAGVLPAPTNI